MSRRSAAHSVARNHIFPFLAVLICTMGALVTLLVVIAQTSHSAGVNEGAAARPDDPRLKDEVEMARWRVDQLKQSRDATTAELSDSRLALAHVEDHLRRLRQDLDALRTRAEVLENESGESIAQATEAELAAMRRKLDEARRKLEEAEVEAASRRPSFAVVPYLGRNGTRRRPIYLECRADSVILQPEGIEFDAMDFMGPLGPGNPLASATRAVREHFARSAPGGAEEIEPYPLLLVRPDGVMAYAAARKALESWGADYGYELVEADWNLAYPAADEGLAAEVGRVADEARARQRLAMMAAPRQYARAGRPSFLAGAPRSGSRDESGSSGAARGAGTGVGTRGAGTSGAGKGVANGGRPGGALGRGAAGANRRQSGPGGTASEGTALTAADGSSGNASGADGPPQPQGRLKQLDGGVAAVNGRPVSSMAGSRGQDWGLRGAALGSVAVARPVLVECRIDGLSIMPEDGRTQLADIPIGDDPAEAVDLLVEKLWVHMKSWGIAGKGLYWRPTLLIDVAPGADERYAQLQTLLSESGLDVRRREAATAGRPRAGSPMPR